ncbi:MAG: hypothetical protein LBT00_00055 [Spirochaetaceae bacterium]|nr:hypothetical protein [Spirochaetaceae bacterium]
MSCFGNGVLLSGLLRYARNDEGFAAMTGGLLAMMGCSCWFARFVAGPSLRGGGNIVAVGEAI